MDLTRYGSRDAPLRASSLPALVGCPLRQVLLAEGLLSDESGEAAQTGSLFHSFASAWHGNGHDAENAVASATARDGAKFPLANGDRARKWFDAYAADPRNRDAVLSGNELRVEVAIPAADHDPTGTPVWIVGTLDQIREERGGHRVYDLKTGRSTGLAMLDLYAYQLAAYTVAAAAYLGVETMLPPAVIRVQGYDVKGVDPSLAPPGVFYPYVVLTWERCHMLLAEIANVVADVRSGRIDVRPGFSCATTCPARGLQNCLPLAERLGA